MGCDGLQPLLWAVLTQWFNGKVKKQKAKRILCFFMPGEHHSPQGREASRLCVWERCQGRKLGVLEARLFLLVVTNHYVLSSQTLPPAWAVWAKSSAGPSKRVPDTRSKKVVAYSATAGQAELNSSSAESPFQIFSCTLKPLDRLIW